MATVTTQLCSFYGDLAYVKLSYEDTNLRVRSVIYQNLTERTLSVTATTNDDRQIIWTAPPGTVETTVDVFAANYRLSPSSNPARGGSAGIKAIVCSLQ